MPLIGARMYTVADWLAAVAAYVPGVDEVLRRHFAVHGRAEHDALLDLEGEHRGVLVHLRRSVGKVGDGRGGAVGLELEDLETLEDLVLDVGALGLLRVQRLDADRLSAQREVVGAARLGRARRARTAARRCAAAAGCDDKPGDDEDGDQCDEAAPPPVASAQCDLLRNGKHLFPSASPPRESPSARGDLWTHGQPLVRTSPCAREHFSRLIGPCTRLATGAGLSRVSTPAGTW